ncbi:hypothetical protein [Variovorax sp. CCNWLW235]|uniref:hypothetical protein n=1 Tax=Variovorax sp. CCNWLW235 TaxID=3127463 RepID=UPI003077571E
MADIAAGVEGGQTLSSEPHNRKRYIYLLSIDFFNALQRTTGALLLRVSRATRARNRLAL